MEPYQAGMMALFGLQQGSVPAQLFVH